MNKFFLALALSAALALFAAPAPAADEPHAGAQVQTDQGQTAQPAPTNSAPPSNVDSLCTEPTNVPVAPVN